MCDLWCNMCVMPNIEMGRRTASVMWHGDLPPGLRGDNVTMCDVMSDVRCVMWCVMCLMPNIEMGRRAASVMWHGDLPPGSWVTLLWQCGCYVTSNQFLISCLRWSLLQNNWYGCLETGDWTNWDKHGQMRKPQLRNYFYHFYLMLYKRSSSFAR